MSSLTRDKLSLAIGGRRTRRGLEASDRRLGVILVLPAVLVLLVFTLYPLINLLWLSLTNFHSLKGTWSFVGIRNFINVVSKNLFFPSLKRTLVFTFGSLAIQAIYGVFCAYILNLDFRGRSLARALLIFPYLVPTVVAATTFRFLFNDLIGIGNHLLMQLGLISKPLNVFGNPNTAMLGVILVAGWKYYPMIMVAVLARLQMIPLQLYEAASIDGANGWTQFWRITFPFVRPVLTIVLLIRSIWLFNHWDLIFLLTGGGPMDRTSTLPLLLFNEAFTSYNLGRASAVGVIVLVILAVASQFYMVQYRKAEERL